MMRKLLIALDDSPNSLRAVEFVAQTFQPECKVTLFSVLPDTEVLCAMNSPELTPLFVDQQNSFCLLEEKKKALMEETQKKAKAILLGAGYADGNIEQKVQHKKSGIARDIANEAKTGYDVIVLGRKGLSGIADYLLGGITQKVLGLAKDMTVLLVK